MKELPPANPDCPNCKGQGMVPVDREANTPPAVQLCKCVLHLSILKNVERGMRGLTRAAPIEKSVLLERPNENLWITAPKEWFFSHLRHVAIRNPPSWAFLVKSDADLMVAWLASAALKGHEIYDADFSREGYIPVSLAHMTLVDLIEPPDLLIIRLGIKAARNQAMPEVLMETLTHRAHLGRPSWVWDQPSNPLTTDHLCFSPLLMEFLSDWTRITPNSQPASKTSTKGRKKKAPTAKTEAPSGGRVTMSSMTGKGSK